MAATAHTSIFSFPVNSASALNEGEFVRFSAATGQLVRTGANEVPIGVMTCNAAASQSSASVALVGCGGIFRVLSGAAVAVGDVLFAGASGRTGTASTGSVAKFIALEAATAAGQLITVVKTE
jgi:predicted RecA/RadA family phage recombinase